MEQTVLKNHIQYLMKELSSGPELKEDSQIILLTGNELANILLKVTSDIRNEIPIDELLENTISLLGKAGIAERVLLFQVNNELTKLSLTHFYSSSYLSRFDLIGFQIDLGDIPFFNLTKNPTVQIQDFSKYLSLPNYIFKNKVKALFIKLKTKSLLFTIGSAKKVSVALNLQFSTREVIWSNEIEKIVQSIADQLAMAIEQYTEKKKKESLQKNIIEIQNTAIKEQEELLRQFASDLHDLPCSVIPPLKKAIKNKDFNECERLADELHNHLRLLINEHVIPDIHLLGFIGAIYQFLNAFKKTFKGNLRIDLPDEEINIPQKKAIELFKVIKEWFCNIEKHSRATEVNFRIKKLNDYYVLIFIGDNGVGFDVNDTKNFGFGIINIKRRLEETNSKFEIKSALNKGSTLQIQLSIN